MTRQANLPGAVVARSQIATTALGMEYLGGGVANGSSNFLSAPNFSARDSLMVLVGITGTASNAPIGIRFNNDGNQNYWSRTFRTEGIGAGLVTFNNNQSASRTDIEIEAGVSITTQRFWVVNIANRLGLTKTAFWQGTVGSATLDPTVSLMGVGEWVTATNTQVTNFLVLTTGTAINAGSRIQIYGRDYP